MNDRGNLRELVHEWRKKRAIRLEARVTKLRGGKITDLFKVLGIKSCESVPEVNVPQKSDNSSGLESKKIKAAKTSKWSHKEPKIKPKDTKLSLQRRLKINPIQLTPIQFDWRKIRGNIGDKPVFRKVIKKVNSQDIINPRTDEATILSLEEKGIERTLNIDNQSPLQNEMISLENEKVDKLPLPKDLLLDLYNIVSKGHQIHDSELWLKEIYNQYSDVTKDPMYWECLAIIKELKVQDLKENLPIDEQIENLERRMKAININIHDTASTPNKQILVDQKNVFNSSNVMFSVKESKEKSHYTGEKEYLVTPVRRSTRSCIKTPSSEMCVKSLFELKPEIRHNIDFKPNMAILKL